MRKGVVVVFIIAVAAVSIFVCNFPHNVPNLTYEVLPAYSISTREQVTTVLVRNEGGASATDLRVVIRGDGNIAVLATEIQEDFQIITQNSTVFLSLPRLPPGERLSLVLKVYTPRSSPIDDVYISSLQGIATQRPIARSEIPYTTQASINLLSVFVGLAAVLVALSGIGLQERVARANLRPILTVYTVRFTKTKAIVLENAGAGTAVITNAVFVKGNKNMKQMPDLVNLDKDMEWDNYWIFGREKHYLRAGMRRDLIRLSEKNLASQGYPKEKIAELLENLQSQVTGITVRFSYEDVFGNRQPDYTRTLP